MTVLGNFKWHQYQVVGRLLPTDAQPSPQLFRMKLWSTDPVRARSRFWYFLSRLRKVKKANGQILAINEIFEKKPTKTKNFGIWVRHQSRTGYHNMFKEFRDLTLNGAVEQMYTEMASRHRVRSTQLHIIKTMVVKAADCKRDNIVQFHDSKIKFPVTRRLNRATTKTYRAKYQATRPSVSAF